MEKNKAKVLQNTLFWGFVLWLFGYILGMIFFAFTPKEMIGWYIMPFGIIATLLVLFKKIKRDSFVCYIGLGIIWAIMAIVLDYVFLVQLLTAANYYKLDVYLYYIITFALPLLVGGYKNSRKKV